MSDFLLKTVLRAHAAASADGDDEALLSALRGAPMADKSRAWITLWWLASESQSMIARRALAFAIAAESRDCNLNPIHEACRLYLLTDETSSRDASTAMTLLTGLQFCVAETGAYPRAASSSTIPFLRSILTHPDVNVFSSCLDFLEHADANQALPLLMNQAAGEALASSLTQRIASLPGEADLARDLTFLTRTKLPKNAPCHPRELLRLAMDVIDAVGEARNSDLVLNALATVVRRRALLDEALSQAVSAKSPVQTVRVLKDDPSAGLLRAVVGYGEAVVRTRRAPDTSEQETPEYGIRFRPAVAASYPIHLTYADDDAKEVFETLSCLLVAAAKEETLTAALARLPAPLLDASRRLLRSLSDADAALEVTLSQPTLAEWQMSTLGRVKKLSNAVLDGIAKRMRDEQRRRTWLARSDVPQANTARLVLAVVDVIVLHGHVDESDVPMLNSVRQINYYRHAARVLGLLDDDNIPTSRAQTLRGLDDNERMRLLAIYFEDSTVGRAWRGWAGVSRLTEVDADSADRFLSECVVGLSGTTPGRRASTLKKWLEELIPFHYASSTDGQKHQ